MSKLTSLFSGLTSFAVRMWRSHRRASLVAMAVVALLVGGYAVYRGVSEESVEVATQSRRVDMISVASYARSGAERGTSTGAHESVLRAESGGMVKRVAAAGSYVSAGTVVAELDNDVQRAALLQMEGTLDSAKASQQKVLEGTRSEQRAILESSYEAAKDNAVNALLSAYGSVDSAIRDTADQMFAGPETATPQVAFTTPDSSRDTYLENTRTALTPILEREKTVSDTLSSDDDLASEIAATQEEVRTVRAFIDMLIAALNVAVPTTQHSETQLSGYKTSATAARAALTGALSSLAGTQSALVNAQKSLEQAVSGAQKTDIASAAAGVKQSQGAYASALAAYEKTLIRARTGGTVVACSAKVGDVVNIGADICRIASSGTDQSGSFALPLSSVRYSPVGAYVFMIDELGAIRAVSVETGAVTADTITVYGLRGDEQVVKDVRGLREGEVVTVE